jgi:uncharacterized lipoprotein YddW (UPF0748 family)
MRNLSLLSVLTICCTAWAQTLPAARPAGRVIEDAGYRDDAAARSAWKAMEGSPAVSVAQVEGRSAVKFPCNFKGSRAERFYWDKAVSLDLTSARGIQFEMNCPDLAAVSSFGIYFQSGGGWYVGTFGPSTAKGWGTVRVEKADGQVEGTPAGWGRIERIRISPWRGGDADTPLYIRDMRVIEQDGPIAIVSGVSVAAADKSEMESVRQYTKTVANRLDELGLAYAIVNDTELTAPRLKDKRLVILPHNPRMPAGVASVLKDYLKGGGKMISFYGLPDGLADAAGIGYARFVAQKASGNFASIRPVKDSPVAGMPMSTGQASWNIWEPKAVEGRSRIAAEWYDAAGKPTGNSAIAASDNCVVMSHVLLDDDPVNKRMLLLSMAGHLVPEFWSQAAQGRVDQIGRLGPYKDLADVRQRLGLSKGSQTPAARKMDTAEEQAKTAEGLLRAKAFAESISAADKARQSAVEAASMAQAPLPGEHRAFWCHSATGVAGMDWDQSIRLLADNGFTDIQPNMLWGGSAYYASSVLPVAREAAPGAKGDQIAQCLAACRKYGVRCHVWKVNWNLGWTAPKDFVERMRKEGRLQVDLGGKGVDWLCPSHPDNRKLEIDSMVEVATKYEVDGIHFDYIRYPGPECCFCPGCRQRFEELLGRKVPNWPQDTQKPGETREKWLEFRRSNITAVVAAVSEAARKARPKIQISAAVFPSWATARDAEGQDWKTWCDKGYLDFVCPMDYTEHTGLFAGQVDQQAKWAGKVPCYPGIGLSCWKDRTDIFKLFEHIEVTRRAKTGGFTIFDYEPAEAKAIVPLCGLGITRKP